MTSNFLLGDLISRINVALKKRLLSIYVLRTDFSLQVLNLLYKNGVIRGFTIEDERILVFLKYFRGKAVPRKLQIVSKPGCRIFWSLGLLSKRYNYSNFSGFFVISTSKGIMTSSEILLHANLSGEVLFFVTI